MRSLTCTFALALLACSPNLPAQEPAPGLQIAVLEGGGARNSILAEQAKPVTVEIRDASGKPLADATVMALLPATGPGAAFSWGSEISSKQTDEKGRVTFSNMRLRKLPGDFPIRLIAMSGGQKSSLTAMQSVSVSEPVSQAPARRWSRRKLAILGIAGAGVAAGIFVALYGGSDAPTTSTIGITPGIPVVAGPQ